MTQANKIKDRVLTVVMTLLSLIWIYPIIMIFFNSLKKDTSISTGTAFELPNAESFTGLSNYVDSITAKGFPKAFWYSLVITVMSVILILVCCSMCAWFITRVHTWYSKALYFLFVFSMVVPFQMLMFTLSATANQTAVRHSLYDLHYLFGIWSWIGSVYVLRIYEIGSY